MTRIIDFRPRRQKFHTPSVERGNNLTIGLDDFHSDIAVQRPFVFPSGVRFCCTPRALLVYSFGVIVVVVVASVSFTKFLYEPRGPQLYIVLFIVPPRKVSRGGQELCIEYDFRGWKNGRFKRWSCVRRQ